MKNSSKVFMKLLAAIIISSVMLYSCTTTVKIPKHPAPGQPPAPPKVEIHNN